MMAPRMQKASAVALVAFVATAWPAGAASPPAGVGGEACASIERQIEAERHRVRTSDLPGLIYRADNPEQRYSAHFGAEDVTLAPRGRSGPASSKGAWHAVPQKDIGAKTSVPGSYIRGFP